MTELEKRIRNNRSEFDLSDPSPGHTDRFSNRLKGKEKGPLVQFWWAAAVIVGMIMIAQLPVRNTTADGMEEATISLMDVSPELAEVELYYSRMIKVEQAQAKSTSPEYQESLEVQLSKLEQDYEDLKQELTASDGDERVVRWMVENYRLRLQLLEMHMDQINESNSNRKDYESDK